MTEQRKNDIHDGNSLLQKKEVAKRILATNKNLSMEQKRQLLKIIQEGDTAITDISEEMKTKSSKEMESILEAAKKIVGILLIIASIVFFCDGKECVSRGLYKKDHYYNSENYSGSINAYVGGDAYNYIINGTYFAGYCALGGSLLICGTISGTAGCCMLFKKH